MLLPVHRLLPPTPKRPWSSLKTEYATCSIIFAWQLDLGCQLLLLSINLQPTPSKSWRLCVVQPLKLGRSMPLLQCISSKAGLVQLTLHEQLRLPVRSSSLLDLSFYTMSGCPLRQKSRWVLENTSPRCGGLTKFADYC